MMIPKPIRHICYSIVGITFSGICALILQQFLGKFGVFLGVFLFPIFSIVGGMPIDNLDLWLRRKTRDPIWLMTDEGRK